MYVLVDYPKNPFSVNNDYLKVKNFYNVFRFDIVDLMLS